MAWVVPIARATFDRCGGGLGAGAHFARRWRVKEPAQGIMATTVNGEVLLENNEHTGALPGKVARDTYYYAHNA